MTMKTRKTAGKIPRPMIRNDPVGERGKKKKINEERKGSVKRGEKTFKVGKTNRATIELSYVKLSLRAI